MTMDEIMALAERCGFVRTTTLSGGRPYCGYKRNIVMFGRELVKMVNEQHAEIQAELKNEREKTNERTI